MISAPDTFQVSYSSGFSILQQARVRSRFTGWDAAYAVCDRTLWVRLRHPFGDEPDSGLLRF